MMNSINDFFNDNPWKDIKVATYPNGRRLYLKDERFWAAIDDNNRPVFFIHEEGIKARDKITNISGINIDIDVYGDNSSRLVCTLLDSSSEIMEKFTTVAKDVAHSCAKYSGKDLLINAKKRILSWSNFLKPDRSGLSDAEFKGFYGELYVFTKILVPNFNSDECLRFWVGTEYKKQDFIVGETAVEIKSSFGGNKNSVIISSLEQLDRNTNHLFLVKLLFNPSKNDIGITLQSMYKECLESFGADLHSRTVFFNKISGYYFSATDAQLKEPLAHISSIIYSVEEGFPCLNSSNTSSAIESCKYSIDLNQVSQFIKQKSLLEIFEYG
jgi:hypothetical protein